jgi:hypothetical protein
MRRVSVVGFLLVVVAALLALPGHRMFPTSCSQASSRA